MTDRRSDQGASAATLASIVIARARSRLAVTEITEEYSLGLLSIFRDEIGGAVSRVSAFLIALLASEDYELDALTWSIKPARGWPFSSQSSAVHSPYARRQRAAKAWAQQGWEGVMRNGASAVIPLRDGGWARARVMEDCLDVSAAARRVGFVSTGGLLRVTVPWTVPRSVTVASIDQPLSNVVDLAVLADRDWPVIAVERSSASQGCTFIANVGTRPYVLPWTRKGG